MTDIVERLRQVQGDNDDAREAADEIGRLRTALQYYAELKVLTDGGEVARRALEPKP